MRQPSSQISAGASTTTRARPRAQALFRSVICAVDGSRSSSEALHQAIALCGGDTPLRLVAVLNQTGFGLAAQPDLSEMGARNALEQAYSIATQAGVPASVSLLRGARTSNLLLAAADEYDLLVLGCHGGSRLGGIMLGSTASQVAHRAKRPTLIARRTVDNHDFPRSVLLATDGSAGSWAAVRTAARLARARSSELRLVHVPNGMHPERGREVRKQMAAVAQITGRTPPVIDNPGHIAERIGEAARSAQSSLIVLGRRGVHGIRALGSVSERVVHRAPCSVMVVPAEGAGD